MKKAVLIFCLVTVQSFAQSVFTNPASLNFETTVTTSKDSLPYWIVNTSPNTLYISDVNIYGDAFSPKETSAVISSGDSARMWIYFSSIQNLTYQNYAFIESQQLSGSIVLPLYGAKTYSEALYSSTQNKWGEELKSALKTIMQQGYTTLGYTIARDRMYGNIDYIGGEVECVYTGRKAAFNTRAGATTNNFNCEHTWPQSKFSSNDPMQSDIHHLFSVDEGANSARSNFPFGKVVSNQTWSIGGSKLGLGFGGVTVFEPRDAHKGDVARTMFYFIIRHQNWANFWTESPYQEAAFREWNKNFPPTDKSRNRNNGIALYQGNRNPFVDHPELADRINTFSGTATVPMNSVIVSSPALLQFGILSGESSAGILQLGNIGNTPAVISAIASSQPAVTVTDTITALNGNSIRALQIHFNPNQYSTDSVKLLTISYNDGTDKKLEIPIIISFDNAVRQDEIAAADFGLFQNYPNPFNPSTTITFTVPRTAQYSVVTLRIFDVLGKEIAVPVNEVLGSGTFSVEFDASRFTSGVYFYHLRAGTFRQTRRMLLLK